MLRFLRRRKPNSPEPEQPAYGGHDAIMEMVGDFRHRYFTEIPPDPRQIDPDRLRYLRERLTNEYAYRWRSVEANGELVDALYHTIVTSTGVRYGLGPYKDRRNEKGESPPHGHTRGRAQSGEPDEFQKCYYITARSMSVLEFIQKHEDAVRLLRSLLPDYGYCLRSRGAHTEARLERADYEGSWMEGSPALAVVLAILEHLERFPQEAAHWRKI